MASHDGWIEKLDAVCTGDEVTNGKPAPDIFTLAARRLGADPATCVVLEDTPLGIQAAKAAGMFAVAVPSIQARPCTRQPTRSLGLCTTSVPSLGAFLPSTIGCRIPPPDSIPCSLSIRPCVWAGPW